MKKDKLYPIIKKGSLSKGALYLKMIKDEDLERLQKIKEIKENIRKIINSNHPIFIRTLKKFLSNE